MKPRSRPIDKGGSDGKIVLSTYQDREFTDRDYWIYSIVYPKSGFYQNLAEGALWIVASYVYTIVWRYFWLSIPVLGFRFFLLGYLMVSSTILWLALWTVPEGAKMSSGVVFFRLILLVAGLLYAF